MKNAVQLKNIKENFIRATMQVLLVFMPANTLFAQKQVKNIVLIHGAFADGSGWEDVYNVLKKKGFMFVLWPIPILL